MDPTESIVLHPVLGGLIAENCLHMLAANVAGNCCACNRLKVERICSDALARGVELENLPALAKKLGEILARLQIEFDWPLSGLSINEPLLSRSQHFQRCDESLDMFTTAVRQRWLSGLCTTGSTCKSSSCGPGGCADWPIICAYQDALRIHLIEWIESVSLVRSQRTKSRMLGTEIHPLVFRTTPAIVLSNLWVLEFVAIVLKSPRTESLIASLRTAVEDWLKGGEQVEWTAPVPEDWEQRCIWWRSHR